MYSKLFYRFLAESFGNQSKGFQLCEKYGVNSAEVMDYVYKNVPQGSNFFSKYLDSVFLNYPTWNSIRERKSNLEETLKTFIRKFVKEKNHVEILDLASGYGHYIFSVLEDLKDIKDMVHVEMRDKNDACKVAIETRSKINKVNVSFVLSNILDNDAYDKNKKYDIVILSGFYDSLRNDIQVIPDSMYLINTLLSDNGIFIYTNQVSHQDLALVNKFFTDTEQCPVGMIERENEIMEYFSKRANFKTLAVKVDSQNRYSVITAQKLNNNVCAQESHSDKSLVQKN